MKKIIKANASIIMNQVKSWKSRNCLPNESQWISGYNR